jgi:beta-galactosidase
MSDSRCLPLFLVFYAFIAGTAAADTARERISLDRGWRFALGHAGDAAKDFGHGTRDFSYLAKAGYGDGPAGPKFDDRAWRVLDVPHDWAAELPFDSRGTKSHGYRAIGYRFPEHSVGWYRKSFQVPQSDFGRRIVVEFDGVHRDARVWINGFYLGEHHSGYTGFHYDLTDYLNYGGDNVLAVRADATLEEGWYYEGAGIYRHVWLVKTAPLHVARHGTFVTTELMDDKAVVTVSTRILNESRAPAAVEILQSVLDSGSRVKAEAKPETRVLEAGSEVELQQRFDLPRPELWSLESPYLYSLHTTIQSGGRVIDRYETRFGVRSVHFDPDRGFFLNGKHVPIRGTNNHQDHAGVGVAVPDALQAWRLQRLKDMGSNAYRAAHNPPTPELLDAADGLGMLVLAENRLMGSSPEQLQELESMILRDRNHPSVIAWSIGNEEWAIENTVTGARIAATLQAHAQRLDPTRRVTAAMSGGWDKSISSIIDLMGFNYSFHGDADAHHAAFPQQPSWFTEESTTRSTRGVYVENPLRAHMPPTDRKPEGTDIEQGLQYCAARPYLAGIFFWTGFDHHGEPNPYGWPQVSSQSGVIDLCGFPKDPFYYLKSWWTEHPVLHIASHWNWSEEMAGRPVDVRVYSNADEVELFLNGGSLGRKPVPRLSHARWDVPYVPGVLRAKAYQGGREYAVAAVETAGQPARLGLSGDRAVIRGDGRDVGVITVRVEDNKGRVVPLAENDITFRLEGGGRIIGVGNGDPSSHEPAQFPERVQVLELRELKSALVSKNDVDDEIRHEYDDSGWQPFEQTSEVNKPITDRFIVVRGGFDLPELTADTTVTLFGASIAENQSLYVNGGRIAAGIRRGAPNQEYVLDHKLLRKGRNVYAAVGTPFVKTWQWEELNTYPGLVQVRRPHEPWRRRAFNGLAQVLVQAGTRPGRLVLQVESQGLEPAALIIRTE